WHKIGQQTGSKDTGVGKPDADRREILNRPICGHDEEQQGADHERVHKPGGPEQKSDLADDLHFEQKKSGAQKEEMPLQVKFPANGSPRKPKGKSDHEQGHQEHVEWNPRPALIEIWPVVHGSGCTRYSQFIASGKMG